MNALILIKGIKETQKDFDKRVLKKEIEFGAISIEESGDRVEITYFNN